MFLPSRQILISETPHLKFLSVLIHLRCTFSFMSLSNPLLKFQIDLVVFPQSCEFKLLVGDAVPEGESIIKMSLSCDQFLLSLSNL